MTNVDALALNLSNNNRKIANIISNFSDLSDSLVTVDISNTMAKADKAIDEIAMMTSRINNGEGTLGQLMVNDSLYNGLVESNVEIQELLDDLQLNPWKYVRVSLFGRKQDAKMSKGDIKRMEKMIREEMEKQQ
jgi:phospholipid/cholesterol/gamma-HCH transport system substrate-binding protein